MIAEVELARAERPAELAAVPPAPRRPGPGRRLAAWVWSHRASFLLLGAVLVAVGLVHAWGMSWSPAPSDDEGTYMAQAWAVQERGQLAHYTYWYDHPPLGWITIAAWTWLTGAFNGAVSAVASGRELMLLVNLANCVLVFLLGRRMGYQRLAAAGAVLMFALSPLGLSYHRMVLLDNMAVTWALAAFVLVSSPTSHLWAYAAGGACFAAALLTKETTLLFLPAVLVQLWTRCDPRTRRFCMTAFVSAVALVVVVYPLAALLKGELLPGAGHVSLVDAVRFQLFTRPATGSVFDPTTTGHRIVREWLGLDAWLLAAGLVLVLPALFSRRLRGTALALAIPAVTVLRGGYLPGPFVIGLLPFAALLVAGAGSALWRRPQRLRPTKQARRLEAVGRSPRAALEPGRESPPSGRHRVAGAARRCVVLAAVLTATAVVGPQWASADHHVMTADTGMAVAEATSWLDRTLPRSSRLLVDDALWVDLVERGFDPHLGVVWFYKLDFSANLDPSVATRLPDGWRHFDYVVLTPVMRAGLEDLPQGLGEVRRAIDNSTPVASFGAGEGRVEVRKVNVP